MAGIRIRKAELSDAPRMAEIGFQAWSTGIFPLLTARPGLREAERMRLSRAVGAGWRDAIVADMQGIVVGWCSRSPGRSYIPYLFVDPDVQSRGIGSMLLHRMEAMLELEGAARIHLETPADHVRAVRFYERQGYKILAMKPDGRGHHPLMSVHLEKRLSPFSGEIGED